MKKKEKAYSIALVSIFIILFLIFVSSPASAFTHIIGNNTTLSTTPEVSSGAGDPSDDQIPSDELSTEETDTATESIQPAELKITEKRITTNNFEQSDPVIYGNKILWYDERNGNGDIYMYDFSTKKETQISIIDAEGTFAPAIYGDKIVCMGYRGEPYEGYDIYTYDISTKKEKRITDDSAVFSAPAIYGDRIVWEDNRQYGSTGMDDIYMYNLSTSKETRITNSGSANYPAIYDNRIVWVDSRNGYTDVYMYDISTKKETQITNNESKKMYSVICSDRIAWMDNRNGSWDIYMYDLSTKKETPITNHETTCYPEIYGDRIVWSDVRNGNWDIYVYDLATHQESHTTDKSDQYDPEIYGDRIVWTDMRNGNRDIYMGTLSKSSPVAAFSAAPTTGKAPLKVKFTDTSTRTPTKWIWDFGDGSKSFHQNPTHKYSKAGVYTVSLTAKNAAGSNTVTKTEYIKVITKPVAAFSASSTSGKVPLKVKFTDTSTGIPAKWVWKFGDGSKSYHQNPVHKYSKAGVYTVSLTVKNAKGSNTVTKSKYITVTAKPVASFSASPTSGKTPLNVKFTDKSTGSPTKWKWDFGDGTKSFHQNPTHKYSKAGKYTVTLKVTNAVGINTATKSKYITVTGTSQAPTADFWGWPLSGKAPLKVKFTETSKGSPTSWKWDFGDGKYSTEKSPTHTYSSAGTYTVKLIATNEAGSSTKSKWKYIKVAK
ncbi:Chitin binding protein [Methanosarcina barkeri MS]|uniref:Chitin binding protein n=2 Tax=Methanosarcina TaxID=2207 RepID=A0A0E3QS17_METBA|nr:PKD domain-containing protein [Methanosarcina barkeri]AKB53319.1 Chitin binding protein [Methanosarcina barkeri MS]